MRSQDVARIASTAPGLRNLVIVSMPEGLLIEHWSMGPSDIDSLAGLMGTMLNGARQITVASAGRTSTDLVAIEATEALIFVAPVGLDAAAGFVFERSTALGMARIQIRDMVQQLEPALRGVRAKPPAAVPVPEPAAEVTARPAEVTHRPAAEVTHRPAAEVTARPAAEVTHRPAPLTAAPGTTAPRLSSSPSAPAEAGTDPARPRAARLLEFLHRYAPDPHVSLLRLSLRTGIALEKLDRPELLSKEQVEAMAASVRDIIGQEQLGI